MADVYSCARAATCKELDIRRDITKVLASRTFSWAEVIHYPNASDQNEPPHKLWAVFLAYPLTAGKNPEIVWGAPAGVLTPDKT